VVRARAAAKKFLAAASWFLGLLWGIWRALVRWFRKYGFAMLVLAAIGGACYLASNVDIPSPVPAFALKAKEVYRLEIGAAFFVVFYLAAMTFVLALSGRGFAQLGTQGLKAEQVVVDKKQNVAFRGQRRFNRSVSTGLADLRSVLRTVDETLSLQDERLKELEKERSKP
jgi:hypothetical protein